MTEHIPKFKMSPGHYRIISTLQKSERTWTELKQETKLDGTTLSQYLKQLTEEHIVKKNPETGKYYFPKTLQPLAPKSYPIAGRVMQTLIEDIGFYGDFIGSLEDLAERQKALTEFLRIHFSLLAGSLVMVVNEACGYEDTSLADEFVQRSLETYFIPWAHLLGIACLRNRELSEKPLDQAAETFLKIAESTYEGFLQRLPTSEAKAKTSEPGLQARRKRP